MFECSFKNEVVVGWSPVAFTFPSDFAHALSKKFFDIQAPIERGFTLNRVRVMARACNQM